MTQQITEALSKLDAMISNAGDAPTSAVTATTTTSTTPASVNQELTTLFETAIATAFPSAGASAIIAACNQPKHGDYQCNNAMPLFAKLKGQENVPKNPRAVAEAIVAALPPSDVISETSLAGPGFINVRVSGDWLGRHLTKMMASPDLLKSWTPPELKGKKVIVDFSSPNVAKEMHVGHLRSTIIGDTIARTLEFCDADVLRLNHIGDWGTQFGMLIQFMTEKRPEGLNAASDEDVADLQVLYKAAKVRFDEEQDFKGRAREAVTRLQSGDPESLQAWQRICDASRREFQKIYDRLGVKLTERGESFYNPLLKDTVDELLSKGVAEISDGATCVFVEGQEIPMIVQKSDGGFGYASTDMAAIKHRIHDEKADWIIYVTDVGQAQHFNLLFGAAKKAGYLPTDHNVRIDHVVFGLVLGEDNKKFRSRSGDVRLVWNLLLHLFIFANILYTSSYTFTYRLCVLWSCWMKPRAVALPPSKNVDQTLAMKNWKKPLQPWATERSSTPISRDTVPPTTVSPTMRCCHYKAIPLCTSSMPMPVLHPSFASLGRIQK